MPVAARVRGVSRWVVGLSLVAPAAAFLLVFYLVPLGYMVEESLHPWRGVEDKHAGAKMQFYVGFLGSHERGLFTLPGENAAIVRTCERCGQPTSTADGLCSFCREWDRR